MLNVANSHYLEHILYELHPSRSPPIKVRPSSPVKYFFTCAHHTSQHGPNITGQTLHHLLHHVCQWVAHLRDLILWYGRQLHQYCRHPVQNCIFETLFKTDCDLRSGRDVWDILGKNIDKEINPDPNMVQKRANLDSLLLLSPSCTCVLQSPRYNLQNSMENSCGKWIIGRRHPMLRGCMMPSIGSI